MKTSPSLLVAGLLLAAVSPLAAQDYAPPPSKPPDEATLNAIESRHAKLKQKLNSLHRQGARDPGLAEVEIYHKAATWIKEHNEYYQADAGLWTIEALDRGLMRASQLAQGEMPWLFQAGYSVIRAYRSRLDGSVQPFAVTYPEAYGQDPRKQWRLDVVLHGREKDLTEIKFLHRYNGDGPRPRGQDFVRIDIYGRGNNGYRWAGEMDVIEVLENFLQGEEGLRRSQLLDPNRVVLRGFSMGGAGTWHLGLHYPDRWCVLGPGAGFTTTHGYIKDLPDKLPPTQEACLRIYDAVDYAENAADVPVVAYAGDKDPQLQAARNIEHRLRPLHIPMTLLVAPGLGHTFPSEWQKKAEEAYAPFLAKGRNDEPEHVHFVTCTMKYPTCAWVEIWGLNRHYERALIDAKRTKEGLEVTTTNVRALRLGVSPSGQHQSVVHIDGQELQVRPWVNVSGTTSNIYLERRDGRWRAVLPQTLVTQRARRLQKLSGLQGPIDDAFTSSFLCVRGSGKPWNPAAQQYADDNLKRFEQEWNRYFRGDLKIKDDVEITDADINFNNLILFGDPGSNTLIAEVLHGLPLQWSKDEIRLQDQTYPAANHVPALIYPSPLNPSRYVVVNSGHTFHAADFRGTNALLYPRLGDYAVLKLTGTEKDPLAVEVAASGLFDDYWQIGKPR